MKKVKVVDTGVISQNHNPGYEYSFACHSHLAQLSNNELLCAFQSGQALYSVDSVMKQARSTDGGNTWNSEGLIYDPVNDKRPYSYHAPVLCRVSNNSLVITAQRWDRSDPKHPVFNEETAGILPAETIFFQSTDNGANWSGPQVLNVPEGMIITPSCPIVVLRDGRWLQCFDQWHDYNDPGPYRARTVGLFSIDEGKNWGNPVIFGDGEHVGKGHWHGRVIQSLEGGLFTMFWTADSASGNNLTLHRSIGSPDGYQWSDPEPTNILGQTNWSVDLGDGKMVVIYTARESSPPGFFTALSLDGGKSWDLKNQELVWDATGRDKIGVDVSDAYPRNHDTISFGAPTATLLADGDIFTTFWCTEISVTQIRYARLRVV